MFSVKVENLLLGSQGQIKLCDFGSATRDHLYPDETWTHSQRTLAEELVCMELQVGHCNRCWAHCSWVDSDRQIFWLVDELDCKYVNRYRQRGW